jgi:hypothetical protein
MHLMNYGMLVWEVNIWYMIFVDKPDLFDYYKSDHNASMLKLY